MNSCRKKDKRYEGYYVGTEKYTLIDSGETIPNIDTTYVQEIEVTYSQKLYTFIKQFNSSNDPSSVSKKEIVDHEYVNMYNGATLKFSGDSMYLNTSNFSDYIENWDVENWEFKGKRN